jgi:predicted metal-dependent enzyme (double-stranded beta helix superfamily)
MPKQLSRRALLLPACAAATLGQVAPRASARAARSARTFDLPRFIEDCRSALAEGTSVQSAIQELLIRELADRDAVLEGLGPPARGGLMTLHRSKTLTILNIVWSPLMQLLPHDHNMWALIGIYTGREDNIFWQRTAEGISAIGARAISAGNVVPLPGNVIHSVNNPIEKLTGAIHVYGGDFFATHRSEWDPETLTERGWSIKEAVRNFEESNARFFGTRRCAPA